MGEHFQVSVRCLHKLRTGKPLRLTQQHAVFADYGVAGIHQIGRRFARAGGCIDVSGVQARALVAYEREQIVMLSRHFVGGGKIEYHVGAGQSLQSAGWQRRPQVFTYLDSDKGVSLAEQQIRPEGDNGAADGNPCIADTGA